MLNKRGLPARVLCLALGLLLLAACAPALPEQPPAPPAGPPVSTPIPPPAGEPLSTPAPAASTQEPAQPAPPSAAPSPAAAEPFQGSRGPAVQQPPSAPPIAQLVDVRVGQHQGFDRVVFEFQGNVPGYHVAYVSPPIVEDGTGDPMEVAGEAFLEVRFEPASGYDFERNGPSYTGPRALRADLPTLLEVSRSGDFEAVLTWVLGLQSETDFRATELQDPLRVVIDVAHPG